MINSFYTQKAETHFGFTVKASASFGSFLLFASSSWSLMPFLSDVLENKSNPFYNQL